MLWGWLSSKNRKRHQRAMNSLVRIMNKNIENDSLWQGRFYVRQVASRWREYEDKSGGELFVVLRLYDKQTGITKDVAGSVNYWRYFNGSHLWWVVNNFIVDITNKSRGGGI